MMELEEIVCFDIGAAGEIPEHWSKFSYKHNVKLNVFAFDENLSKDENPKYKNININFIPILLGEKKEKKKFYILNRHTGSSLYKINERYRQEYYYPEYHDIKSIEDVELKPLHNIIDDKKVLSPDLIKLDTQGSELDIIKGMKDKISKTILIETEVEFFPIYENQPLFNDIDIYLKKNDFELFDLRTGRIFHTNGIKGACKVS